jgi:hypothetical protein
MTFTCLHCGARFARPPRGGRQTVVCSETCRKARHNARVQAARARDGRGSHDRVPEDELREADPVGDPTCRERAYSDEELAFLKAVDRFRRESRRPYPTACELLAVAISCGYRKVAPAGPLPRRK